MQFLIIGAIAALLLAGTTAAASAAGVGPKVFAAATKNGHFKAGATFIYWNRWDELFRAAAARYGIDWRWLKATALVESSLGQNARVLAGAVSEDGKSWGLMQFTLPTANDMRPGTTIADINNPEISIEMAAKYLKQLKARFPGDTRKAIISYNQGPGNTAKGNDFTGPYWNKWSDAMELINRG